MTQKTDEELLAIYYNNVMSFQGALEIDDKKVHPEIKKMLLRFIKEEGEKLEGKTDEYSNGGYCMLVIILNKINKTL